MSGFSLNSSYLAIDSIHVLGRQVSFGLAETSKICSELTLLPAYDRVMPPGARSTVA